MFRIFIFGFFFTLNYGLVYAQCDASLVPVENRVLKYQQRGKICEGFYESKVSDEVQLFLLALTIGEFHFKNDAAEVITLSVPSAGNKSVHIRAQGLPKNLYYRMDANLTGNETLSWPVAPALIQRDASSRDYNIGVLAFQGEEPSRVYYATSSQTKSHPQSKPASLIFKFRATARLASFQYQLDAQPLKTLEDVFTEGAPILLNLGTGVGKGKHTLVVQYREEGKDPTTPKRYTFYL